MQRKLLNNRTMMNPQDTYVLRGVCMIMIIVHHVLKLMPDCPMSLWRWGDLGTAVFFFISGWGLYASMDQRSQIDFSCLWHNLKKLIVPFYVVWVFVEIVFKIIHPEYYWTYMLRDAIILQYPSFEAVNLWFIKVIVLVYVVSILTFIFSNKRLIRLSCISLVCVAYILIAWRVLHLPEYMWCSVACFPLGMWLYAFRNELQAIMKQKILVFVISCLIYVLFLFYDFLPMPASIKYEPAFCLMMVSTFSLVNIQSNFLYFIGKNSLLFYLIHIAILLLLTKLTFFTQQYMLMLGVVFFSTTSLVYIYVKLQTYIQQNICKEKK